MAVRNPKITRDVFNSCKQFVNFKSDIASIPGSRSDTKNLNKVYKNNTLNEEDARIRYMVTNTHRPEMLPKFKFRKNPDQSMPSEMQRLQPAMLPKFLETRNNPENFMWQKCVEQPAPSINVLRTQNKQKANLKKPLQLRFGSSSSIRKNICMNPYLIPIRSMTSQGPAKKTTEYDHRSHCPEKPKTCNKMNNACPKFILNDCPKSKGSDCQHHYINRKCQKKTAPYPSYSESCAERLEGDPSECFQCPWQKCALADTIKPQKRKYHRMAASTDLIGFTPSTVAPLYSPAILDLNYICDATKKPCERPPGKCEKERKKREKQNRDINAKVEEHRHFKINKDKHASDINGLFAKEQKRKGKLPFNENLGNYDYVRKRKCQIDEKCKKKPKKSIVPEGCITDNCKKCTDRNSIINLLSYYLTYECKNKDRKDDCPPITITPVPLDKSEDPSLRPDDCCENEKKGMKLSERRRRKRHKVTQRKNKS